MSLKNVLDQFRLTLPLIKMLREPYMRERHWEKLQKHLGQLIEVDEKFTLAELFKY